MKKYDLVGEAPASVLSFLEDNHFSIFKENSRKDGYTIIGSNAISAEAAKAQAEKEGFFAEVVTTSLEGEAAQVGRELGMLLRRASFHHEEVLADERWLALTDMDGRVSTLLRDSAQRPFCLIFGGETTVNLGTADGLGGRNQEVALAAVKELAGVKNIMLITLATDGDDGPTDAAGAVVTGQTLARAQALKLDLGVHLRDHDAYPFFDALDDLLKPGMTGTNVNDLTFLFSF